MLTICKKLTVSASALVLLTLPMALPAAAQTWNAVTDFSTTTNTNTSTWSYRSAAGTVRDGNYSLLSTFGPSSGYSPTNPGLWSVGGGLPAIGVNQTGSDVNYTAGPGFTWANNTMLVHPGNLNLVVLSWLSPITGNVSLSYSFADIDSNSGNGISWFVERNSSINTLASGTLANGGSTTVLTLSAVSVTAGDRINFIVDPNGEFTFDSTRLTASVSASSAPEPGSFLFLLSGGLVGAGVVARRRRSAHR